MKTRSNIEAEYYDYLLGRGYAKSTAADYVYRLRKIAPIEDLVKEDLDALIEDYEKGSMAEANKGAHNSYSSALKRLREFI